MSFKPQCQLLCNCVHQQCQGKVSSHSVKPRSSQVAVSIAPLMSHCARLLCQVKPLCQAVVSSRCVKPLCQAIESSCCVKPLWQAASPGCCIKSSRCARLLYQVKPLCQAAVASQAAVPGCCIKSSRCARLLYQVKPLCQAVVSSRCVKPLCQATVSSCCVKLESSLAAVSLNCCVKSSPMSNCCVKSSCRLLSSQAAVSNLGE